MLVPVADTPWECAKLVWRLSLDAAVADYIDRLKPIMRRFQPSPWVFLELNGSSDWLRLYWEMAVDLTVTDHL